MSRWKPSLEGSLAIFNVLSLAGLFFLARLWRGGILWDYLALAWAMLLTLPLAWYFLLLLSFAPPTPVELFLGGVLTVFNAIVWGRVAAALLQQPFLPHPVPTAESDRPPED